MRKTLVSAAMIAMASTSAHATVIYGTAGPNTITGTTYADTIYGYAGGDTLAGHKGNDKLYGGRDRDRLIGGSLDSLCDDAGGADLLDGGDGDDVLAGHQGPDVLKGQNGNDSFYLNAGNDRVTTGAGTDALIFIVFAEMGWQFDYGCMAANIISQNMNKDLILDFAHGVDKIFVRNYDYSGVDCNEALFSELDTNNDGKLTPLDVGVTFINYTYNGTTKKSTLLNFDRFSPLPSSYTHEAVFWGVTNLGTIDFPTDAGDTSCDRGLTP